MKKLSILLIGLLLVAGFVSAEVTFTLSGESTLTWGIKGSLIDNSAGFGDVNVNDLAYTTDSGAHSILPDEIVLAVEVADGDTVIVAAQSTIDVAGTNGGDLTTTEEAYEDAFDWIDFPNVIPGMVGIKLLPDGTLETDVTETASATGEPNILVTATPMEGLTAKLGLLVEQSGLLRDTLPTFDSGDEVIWNSYIDFAASIYAEYVLALGEEDEDGDFDNVTVAVGTVFDTAYTSGVWTEVNASVFDETYGPWNVVADAAIVNPEDVEGLATLPLGLSLDADVAGLTAGVDVRARLVQGADVADIDAAGALRPAYEMPLYAGLDVGYELEMGDMTVTPSANFMYSGDFWKWAVNSDFDGLEYTGNVKSAEFLGRPMSAAVGVEVAGIADILDVSLSAAFGFGDGEYDHGLGLANLVGFGLGAAPYAGAYTLADLAAAVDTARATNVVDVNDGWFATGTTVIKGSLGLTLTAIEGLTVTNDTSYTVDGLGIETSDIDIAAPLFGVLDYYSKLENDTTATYEIMVGETAAITLFGKLNIDLLGFGFEQGVVLQTDGTLKQTEMSTKTVADWDIGIEVSVATD